MSIIAHTQLTVKLRSGCRIESIVTLLKQKNPQTSIILMGLLPRGDGEQHSMYTQPNKYTQGIINVNAGLQKYSAGQSQVQYLDCGSQLLPNGKVCLHKLDHLSLEAQAAATRAMTLAHQCCQHRKQACISTWPSSKWLMHPSMHCKIAHSRLILDHYFQAHKTV